MKTKSKPQTAEEKWPEIESISMAIFNGVIKDINAIRVDQIKTTCPYVRQCVLEMLMKKIDAAI